jgi:hypothetical protein
MKEGVKDFLDFLLVLIAGILIGYGLYPIKEEAPYPSMVPEFFSRPINSTGGGF